MPPLDWDSLSLNLELTDWRDWLLWEPWSLLFLVPSPWLHCAVTRQPFTCVLEIQTEILMLAHYGKRLSHWATSPVPSLSFLLCQCPLLRVIWELRMDLCKPLAQLYIHEHGKQSLLLKPPTMPLLPQYLYIKSRVQVLFLSMLKTVYVYLHNILEFQVFLSAAFFFGFICEDEKQKSTDTSSYL